MDYPVTGIHHLTACASGAQEDIDFFTKVVGQRMIKQTILFDGRYAHYHFYYANGKAEPSMAVLQLLRLTVSNLKPNAVNMAKFAKEVPARRGRPPIIPEWGRAVMADLAKLDDADRAQAIKRIRPLIKRRK